MHEENNHHQVKEVTVSSVIPSVRPAVATSIFCPPLTTSCSSLWPLSLFPPRIPSLCSSLISTEQMFHRALDWIMEAFSSEIKASAPGFLGIRCPPFFTSSTIQVLPRSLSLSLSAWRRPHVPRRRHIQRETHRGVPKSLCTRVCASSRPVTKC